MLTAEVENPLLPVDTSSPQATLRTFFDLTEAFESAYLAARAHPTSAGQAEAQRLGMKLRRLLDLSEVPPALRRTVARDTIVFLVDILRRIDVPALDTIPDAASFPDADKPASWSIPRTEITISRISEGARKGAFLFNSETVARAEEFYLLVKHLPLKRPAKLLDWRGEELQAHGWMIPSSIVYRLPQSLRLRVLDTPAWKLLGSVLMILCAAAIVALWHRFIRPERSSHSPTSYMRRLLTPLALVIATYGVEYFIVNQLLETGPFSAVVNFATVITLYVAVAWAIWVAIFVIIEWIIASPSIPDQSLDANLLRLLGRVIGIVGIALVVGYGAQQLGVPVFGVVAGLGVGGIAVALAAQGSIENFIGGLNLYADRPLRVGDFCEYGTVRGHVEYIGLRSTKIRGLDRTVTSVPNSQLAKTHITNYARRDQMLFRHVLDLRYETTTEQLRTLARAIQDFLVSHPKVRKDVAVPRVHVIGFGDWSIKAEIYAYLDTTQLPEFLAIQEELALQIIDLVKDSGSDFAFPSQTTYIEHDGFAAQMQARAGAASAER